MAPPTIRSTVQDAAAAPSYSVRHGRPPLAGDMIVMFLPLEHPTPPGWTRNGPVLHRTALGDERTFPGPAAWFSPDDVRPDGTAEPAGMTNPRPPRGTENSHP